MSESDDIVFDPGEIPTHWPYVAYGHTHKPQTLPGADHVRYAGSIERFDYGEKEDKSVTLVEIGPKGRVGNPKILPLDATPSSVSELVQSLIKRSHEEEVAGAARLAAAERIGCMEVEDVPEPAELKRQLSEL